jgi:hypothetical protein
MMLVLSSGVFLLTFFVVYEMTKKYRNVFLEKNRIEKIGLLSVDENIARSFFVDDVRNSVNDQHTKQSAYFVFQKYINSGNIYELYDYVNSHTELAFLKEAETLRPKDFERVRKKKTPFHYTDQGLYIYLAYLEILEKNGYANESILASLSYRYAQMAYYNRMITEDKLRGESLDYPSYTIDTRMYDTERAVFFAKKADDAIRRAVNVEGEMNCSNLSPDLLGSVVQYASALRYFESLEVSFTSSETSGELFKDAMSCSHEFIPNLYLVTALTNAATLLLVPSSDAFEMRNAVFPFLDYRVAENGSLPVIGRMLRSRVEADHIRFMDMSIYSKQTMVSIAERVPDFKEWLMSNGWGEADF